MEFLILALMILMQTPAPQPGYVDIHHHPQSYSIRKQCPQGTHLHPKKDMYPALDPKTHKAIASQPGDDKCHNDWDDKVATKNTNPMIK